MSFGTISQYPGILANCGCCKRAKGRNGQALCAPCQGGCTPKYAGYYKRGPECPASRTMVRARAAKAAKKESGDGE